MSESTTKYIVGENVNLRFNSIFQVKIFPGNDRSDLSSGHLYMNYILSFLSGSPISLARPILYIIINYKLNNIII